MGTALTSEQVKLLSRAAKRIVVVFDGDAAGARAAEKAIPVAVKRACSSPRPTLMAAWRRCRPALIQTTSCGRRARRPSALSWKGHGPCSTI